MSYNRIDSAMLTRMFLHGTHLLNINKDIVNALNVYPVPDGDTGTNMSLTMNSAISEVEKKIYETCSEVAKSIAKGSLMGARGNSGVILSQIFRGFSKGCENYSELTVPQFAIALKEASDMAYRAVLKPVEGTILTIIRELADKAVNIAEEDMLFHHFFKLILDHGQNALNKTTELLAALKQAGVVDAGGQGLLHIIQGFEEVVQKDFEMPHRAPEVEAIAGAPAFAQAYVANIEHAYCTEFIISGAGLHPGDLKEHLKGLGDSLVFVADDDLIKVHVHTNHPGKALEYGLQVGQLENIKIENMKQQHHALMFGKTEDESPQKNFGFLAISSGEGLSKILYDLGVDRVIEGGQTMNPSTEDILKGLEEINAKTLFVLPNNSNIILAANQAKDMANRPVIVIPSKTIPQGISAMIHFNKDQSVASNQDQMNHAIEQVKSLQITYAVRDTQVGDLSIKEEDYLGILDGDIIVNDRDRKTTVLKALKQAIDSNSEILTVYYGEQTTAEEAKELTTEIEKQFNHIEVEVYPGGQPVYCYLFSIE